MQISNFVATTSIQAINHPRTRDGMGLEDASNDVLFDNFFYGILTLSDNLTL